MTFLLLWQPCLVVATCMQRCTDALLDKHEYDLSVSSYNLTAAAKSAAQLQSATTVLSPPAEPSQLYLQRFKWILNFRMRCYNFTRRYLGAPEKKCKKVTF